MIKVLLISLLLPIPCHADEIPKFIKRKALEYKIDPDLVYAIAKVESSLNPNAIGKKGEVGLFQLRPEFHDVRYGDYKHNTEVAIKYLAYVKRRCQSKYKHAWFICFNTGPNRTNLVKNPEQFAYYRKVMSEYRKVTYAGN